MATLRLSAARGAGRRVPRTLTSVTLPCDANNTMAKVITTGSDYAAEL